MWLAVSVHKIALDTPNTGSNVRPKSKPIPAKARELLSEQRAGLPIWIRSPKQGVEFHSGLSRSKLYELAGYGHIRSVSIREPGQVKGTRLFHLQSVLDFVAKCEVQAGTQKLEEVGNV
jgi:hypothetical protein